ncbi:MAG TPA: ABC transporter ATP-binding protein [Hyphomicrobiales bacterium]
MTILDVLRSPELEPLAQPAHAGAEENRDRAVELRKLTKRYGSVVAVDAADFTVARGTLVTLLGPSGCGKTTTLRLIAGLEMASDGRLFIDGEDVTNRAAYERDVSMVFQSYALFPHMNVLENVSYGLKNSGLKRRRVEELAAEKLSAVGLSGFEKRFPSELSGGQQQRVAVARAIVLEPKVLLFDEPLSNLDAKLRRRVREDIRALQQRLGLTVVYVTHDQEEALAVSDRIIVMKDARIVQDGTPRDLYERPANRFIADFIGNANILPVTIERVEGDKARVTLAALELQVQNRGMAAGKAELSVRPQSFRLRPGAPEAGEIAGTIGKAAYLGSHMEYGLTLDGIDTEIFVIDGNVAAPHAPATRVAVTIDPAGVAIIP